MLRNVNDAGPYNTLGNHRYLRFTCRQRTVNITVTASSSNPDAQSDTDFLVWREGRARGPRLDPPPTAGSRNLTAAPGTYVIDVYDCANGCVRNRAESGDYNITVTVN